MDWKKVEKEVVQTIRNVADLDRDSMHAPEEIRGKIRADTLLPCIELLERFLRVGGMIKEIDR